MLWKVRGGGIEPPALTTDLLAVKATDHMKLPAVALSQRLMWLIVSVPVIAKVPPIEVRAIEPADDALNVQA
jgi:hypothetical protein